MGFNYADGIETAQRGGEAMFLGGSKGQHMMQQGAAQARLADDFKSNGDGKADASVILKDYKGGLSVEARKFAPCKSVVSQLRTVLTLDTDHTYITPWANGDFTVSLRKAYDTLKGPKPEREVTAAIIADKVRKDCERHEVSLADVLAILNG